MYHAAVLTVSDRSFRGERPDAGGPLVAEDVLLIVGLSLLRKMKLLFPNLLRIRLQMTKLKNRLKESTR